MNPIIETRPFRVFSKNDLDRIPRLQKLPSEDLLSMKAVAAVLPFRVNSYIVEELIDWDDIPNDPIYQLCFPQPGMLDPQDLATIRDLIARGAPQAEIAAAAHAVQRRLNPHPAGQTSLNVPKDESGHGLPGMQHKYRETVLCFPMAGQTCHAYCTYCFRWAQFVGLDDMKFAAREAGALVDYLRAHHEVRSVLFTGGDPMVMRSKLLRQYIEPLLAPEFEHIGSIRIGSKSLAWWPYRFLTDPDADDVLRLFNEVRAAGKNLAFMAHYSHPNELSTDAAQMALRAVIDAGVTVRCQAPLIRHVNDDARAWSNMWNLQVRLGAVPYYMFVERDTGARGYFEVPLVRAYEIFTRAYRNTSGLARTVRGPSMSCTPGKVMIDGVAEMAGEKVFVLKMVQGRNPSWANRVFFAKYDEKATWFNQLQPAFGERRFFFADDFQRMKEESYAQVWFPRNFRPGEHG